MSALATLYGKCTEKLIFRLGRPILCYHIADADIGSLNSLLTLFDKYLDHMLVKFEQNRMVQSIQNFNKALMPFWKTFL